MVFFKKVTTQLNSEEYEKISKRLTEVESETDRVAMALLSIRGLIHRKYPGHATADKTETIKNTDGLNELRNL